jgi:hypothetical protein
MKPTRQERYKQSRRLTLLFAVCGVGLILAAQGAAAESFTGGPATRPQFDGVQGCHEFGAWDVCVDTDPLTGGLDVPEPAASQPDLPETSLGWDEQGGYQFPRPNQTVSLTYE